jgi:hypothetical protein
MPSTACPGTWQDVYYPWYLATKLYVKIGRDMDDSEFVVYSFKVNGRAW